MAIDVYHVWWDPELEANGARRAGGADPGASYLRLAGADPDPLNDRGMMGDGVVDLKRIRGWFEAAGFHGPQEVEIFSAENWWKRDGDEVLADLRRALPDGVLRGTRTGAPEVARHRKVIGA